MDQEAVLREVMDRVQMLPNVDQLVTRDDFNEMVEAVVVSLLGDEKFMRKMRFSGGADPKLSGSIYARYGYSIGDLEFLYDLQRSLHNTQPSKYSGPSERLRNAFDHVSQAVYVPQEQIRQWDKHALDNEWPRIPRASLRGTDLALFDQGRYEEMPAYQRALRAMDTAESGYGQQLIGAQYVGDLWEGARQESRIFRLLQTFEMQHPTAYLPVEADIPEMLYVSENTGATDSPYSTSKTGSNRVQVSAKKFVIHQVWSGEMEEDSIIPFIPFLRRQVEISLAHYADSAVLNGDTTNAATGNINLDDADPADTKHYLAFDGVRHAFLVDNTDNGVDHSGAAITYDALLNLKAKMVDTTYLMNWGSPTMAEDLVYVADPFTSVKIAGLDEVLNSKIQNGGRDLLNGEVGIGAIMGHPVINSIAMSKTEADGKVSDTDGNNTLGQVAAFNRRGLVAGWRRRVLMETERLPGRDQTRLVHSLRMGLGRFSPTGSASGIEWAAGLYNISLA